MGVFIHFINFKKLYLDFIAIQGIIWGGFIEVECCNPEKDVN